MSRFLILFLFTFFAVGQEASKTGVLPREVPPELQPKAQPPQEQHPQKQPNAQPNKKPKANPKKEEAIPLIPENSLENKNSDRMIPINSLQQPVQQQVQQPVQQQPVMQQQTYGQPVQQQVQQQPVMQQQTYGQPAPSLEKVYSAPIIIEEEKQNPLDNFDDEYNNLLIESAPIYQKIQEGRSFSNRWGISASANPFTRQSGIDLILINMTANFGWVFSKFEVGPVVSLDMNYRIERVGQSLFRTLDFIFGGFMEYNFIPLTQRTQFIYPALGIDLGYNRFLEQNRFYTRPYFVAKSFLSESVALEAEIGLEWRSSLGLGQAVEDIWGIRTNIGFLKYF